MCKNKYGITVLSARSKKSHLGPLEFLGIIAAGSSWSWKRQRDGRFALSLFDNSKHIATCYTDGEIYMGTGTADTKYDLIQENIDIFLKWADYWRSKNKWAETWKPKN